MKLKKVLKLIKRFLTKNPLTYFDRFRWWLGYRFDKKHIKHKVFLNTKPGWIDSDQRMLLAVIEVFRNYIEEECATLLDSTDTRGKECYDKPLTDAQKGIIYIQANFLEDIEHCSKENNLGQELITIYKWFFVEKPQMEKSLKEKSKEYHKKRPKGFSMSSFYFEKYKMSNEHKMFAEEYSLILQENSKITDYIDSMDDIMLKRLMDVRLYLWS